MKTLIMALAATLVCSGAFAQPGSTPDTVKLVLLDATPGATGNFAVQILVSLDSALQGGNLGFNWSDNANWEYDSTVFGAGMDTWTVKTTLVTLDSNGLGAVLIGGAKFLGTAFPAGPDQVWATMFFRETDSSTWSFGDNMLIDSVFVPTNGDFLLVVDISNTSVTPNFTGAVTIGFGTDIETISDGAALPKTFALAQNYPNPFNPSTKINFDTPKKAHVTLTVYNALGQQVITLVNQELDAGKHSVVWEGNNDSGVKVASGMYFYKLISADFVKSRKMMLVK